MAKKWATAFFFATILALALVYMARAQSADTTPPSRPTGISATVSATNQITVSWTASTDNTGVAGYYVYRDGQGVANTGSASFVDTPGAGIYYYTVAAYDAAGNISLQSDPTPQITIAYDTTPPTAPTSLSSTVTTTSITISWAASTDNVGVVGYNVYRDGVKLNTSTAAASPYVDTGNFNSGYTYTYSVSSYDAAGNVSPTAGLRVLYDITPPSVPAGLRAATTGDTYITLSWQPSLDDWSGLAGYYLYRGGALIATISPTSTTYADTGLASSTAYTYTLSSYDKSGNVSSVTGLTVTTLAVPPVTITYSPPTAYYAPPVTMPAASSTASSGGTGSGTVLSQNLYYGSKGSQVLLLQIFLSAHGYLKAQYATGFYGALTQAAVKQFQCAANIVCSGGPGTTGWGSVGPKTRKTIATTP